MPLDSSTSPPVDPASALLLGNETENNAQNIFAQRFGAQTARQPVNDRQNPHISQQVALQTRIREGERRSCIYLYDIMSSLPRLGQAKHFGDYSSEEGNDTLRHDIRALRE